jgi:hypothetical protein
MMNNESEIKVMKRMGIEIKGDIIEVFPYKENQRLDKGFGYIHDDKVYIYRGRLKKVNNEVIPGSAYMDKNRDIIWIKPSEDESEEFSVSRIFPLSLDGIYEEMQNADNFKAINPVMLEYADNYFAPRINDDDDVLKILVKKALAEIKSSVKPADGSGKDNKTMAEMVNNLKSNLSNNKSRMSILYFAKWCWVLGLKCTISVEFTNSEGKDVKIEDQLRYNYNIR